MESHLNTSQRSDPMFGDRVQEIRVELLGFARSRLRNDAWAEDAVSETLLVALECPQAFHGRSQLKTWLVGILKHKVVDQVRHHTRESNVLSDELHDDLDGLIFTNTGHRVSMPAHWASGPGALQQRQFLKVLEACHQKLPILQRRAFVMREWMDLDTDEICQELNITAEYFFVIMHRVRTRLRECLELEWLQSCPQGTDQ